MSTAMKPTTLSDSLQTREIHSLPFTVTLATTESDIARAVAVRSSAYLRHRAPAADKLRVAEADDCRTDVILLFACSKLDGGVLGTIRIHPNFEHPMKFEDSVRLPSRFDGKRCVEFMRLGVVNGLDGRLVTSALAKASYEICVANAIDYIFVASRPPVDAVYRGYRFDDLLGGEKVDLSYAPGAKHSILCLPVKDAEARWSKADGAVHRFFMRTEHPDISVDYVEVARRFPWWQLAEASA